MALSKTQTALRLVSEGVVIKAAAAQAGIAESTLRMALGRTKGKDQCPCCNQVVRAGFEVNNLHAASPELFEALFSLHQYCRETDAAYRNGLNGTDPLYVAVKAAITKATGSAA